MSVTLTEDIGLGSEKTLVVEWRNGLWQRMQAPMAVSFEGMTDKREVNQMVLTVRGNDTGEVSI